MKNRPNSTFGFMLPRIVPTKDIPKRGIGGVSECGLNDLPFLAVEITNAAGGLKQAILSVLPIATVVETTSDLEVQGRWRYFVAVENGNFCVGRYSPEKNHGELTYLTGISTNESIMIRFLLTEGQSKLSFVVHTHDDLAKQISGDYLDDPFADDEAEPKIPYPDDEVTNCVAEIHWFADAECFVLTPGEVLDWHQMAVKKTPFMPHLSGPTRSGFSDNRLL